MRRTLAHPDWLDPALDSLSKSIALYRRGLIPSGVQPLMFVVPVKHLLRAIYGSDLRAGVSLVAEALNRKRLTWWTDVSTGFGWLTTEEREDQEAMDRELREL